MFVTLKMHGSCVGGRGDDVMNCNGTAVMIFLQPFVLRSWPHIQLHHLHVPTPSQ